MKKNNISIVIALLLSIVFTVQVSSQTQIATVEELAAINDDATSLRGRYKLMNDLNVENWTPIGSAAQPFLGSFDGGGFTITVNSIGEVVSAPFKMRSGEKIPVIETLYVGVFGFNGRRSLIQNLRVDGEIVFESEGNENIIIGGITGANYGTVNNCVSEAAVAAKGFSGNSGYCFAGGIIGINNGINRNCYSGGNISAEGGAVNYAGGIAGLNDFDAGIIQWCYAAGDVSVKGDAEQYAGGIAGLCARGGLVQYCVALNGSILSDKSVSSFTGHYSGRNLGREGNNFGRRDITLTEDTSRPNRTDLYELSSLQDTEWWTVNRHIRFAFGSDNARPWAWNKELSRPVLHWESGATTDGLTARNRSVAPSASSQTVIEIRTAEDLASIGADLVTLKKKYILMDDITLENWTPIGYDKGDFSGTFDGNGYTVTILNVKVDTINTRNMYRTMNIGLFSVNKGLIKNLYITGELKHYSGTVTLHMGGIAGVNDGKITGCVSTANISGDGGLHTRGRGTANLFLGAAAGGIIVYQNGAYAGGVVGINRGSITNCYTTGDVSVVGDGYKSAGGIAGGNGVNGGKIINCYATGNISSKEDNGVRFAGGISGINMYDATIENCVALNKSLTSIGKSNGIKMDGTGIQAHNNINYTVGMNMSSGQRSGTLKYAYYRGDMKITKEKEADEKEEAEEYDSEVEEQEGEGNMFRRATKGRRVNYGVTQNKQWWIGTPKRFGFKFGEDDNAPWVWDEGFKLPVLYWETESFMHLTSSQEEDEPM